MKTPIIYLIIYAAMISMSFWESYVEGRNAWSKKKYGWKINLGKFTYTGYHFYINFLMFPLLLALPLIVNGWSIELFGVLLSAYISGLVIEDFFWYIVNPEVKFKEWFTPFSDYYPWIKINNKKIMPLLYIVGIALSIIIYLWTN